MLRQEFNIEHYWKVIVFYDMDYDSSDIVRRELVRVFSDIDIIDEMLDSLNFSESKAATCSSSRKHISYVIFNKHHSRADLVNSIVHEAVHVKQVVLEAYEIEDRGEPPAYTMGFIVEKMWETARDFICL